MRTLSLVALSLILTTPALAQVKPKPASERSKKRRAKRGKFEFKEQTYKLPKLLQLMGELTRKNFILGKELNNKEITIYCQSPVTITEAYRVFVSALAAHKLSLVKVGRFYRVVKAKDAVKGPSPTFIDGRMNEVPYDERMVTVLHKLRHLDGDNLLKVLKKMVSSSGSVQIVPPRLLLISDSAMNVHRLMRLVKHLDQAGATHQIHYYEARFADAGDLAAKLGEVFTVLGKKKKKAGSKSKISAPSDVVLQQVVADDRTNTLIIVSEAVAYERAVQLLDRLDLPTPDDEGAIHVLRLENADAKELSATLSGLISGLSSQRNRKGKSKAKKKKAASGVSADGLFTGEVKVSADEATNSLVVVASRNDLRVLQRIVKRLDYRRPQVFVEAAFLELSVKEGSDMGASMHSGVTAEGTDWVDASESPWVAGALAGGAGIVGSTTGQGLRSISPVSAAGLLGLVGAFQGVSIPGLDEAFGVKLPTFGVVFQALKSTTGVDVLSTPHLLTTDNEEAEITVGKNVPFASSMMSGLGNLASLAGAAGGSTTSGLGALGGLGLPSMSIQRQDVALKLKMTPHVTNTGQVRMELEAEISELGGIEPTTNSPITTQRKIKTVVVAGDSQTIVIGGLMGDRKTDSVTKIPLLGDLPLLGALFRSKKTEVDKTNLLLVLTPHIVTNDEDFARIFERKLEERREYAQFMSERANKFRPTMNWQRKVGPFGRLDRDLNRHLKAIENGGQGSEAEEVLGADVTPTVKAATEAVKSEVQAESAAKPAATQAEAEPAGKLKTDKPAKADSAAPAEAKSAKKKD